MTSCLVVPSAPQCLRVLNKSTSQIKIIWEPPATSNGVLKGYQIVVRGTTDIMCCLVQVQMIVTLMEFEVTYNQLRL